MDLLTFWFLRIFADSDKNGTIDINELKKCLKELNLSLSEEEVKGLYGWCDVDGSKGIQFNEFIVLLCLIYLLSKPSSESNTVIIDDTLTDISNVLAKLCCVFLRNQKRWVQSWLNQYLIR